ncbi:MAG: cyclic nucleotide-binding domain-containing protein [Bdellovibrionales bacterium]|nr:cyclic nucleotide-binding domain-containing protein [Bdellovibrionales bacterium]
MRPIQYLQLCSVLGALAIGFYVPIRLLGVHVSVPADFFFDFLISGISSVNIYLHFRRAGVSPRKLRSWLSPGLWMDTACLVPFSLVDPSLVVINLLASRHVWRIKGWLDEFPALPPILYRLVPIALMMPLLVHLIACAWMALGSGSAGPDPDRVFEYVKAVYWAFTTLTTVGYGDIAAKTAPQMLFCCGVQVIGVGVFGFVISNVASLLSRMDAAREHHMESVDRVETYMRSHSIPAELRSKVREYHHYLWKHHKGYQDHTLLEDLPPKMQSEMFLFINKAIIEKVPFLQGADHDLIEDLMNVLKPRIFVPGERIFHAGEMGDAMYFIHNGRVEILDRENRTIARLGAGAFFGEMALVADGRRTATARAEGYTYAYVLPREEFRAAVETYPDFRDHIQAVMKQRAVAA